METLVYTQKNWQLAICQESAKVMVDQANN